MDAGGFPACGRTGVEQLGQTSGLAPEEVLAFIHGKQAITSLAILWRANPRLILPPSLRVWTHRGHGNRRYYRASGGNRLTNHLNKAGIPWAIVTSGSMPVRERAIK